MWAQRNKLNKKGTEFWVRELEKASMKKNELKSSLKRKGMQGPVVIWGDDI